MVCKVTRAIKKSGSLNILISTIGASSAKQFLASPGHARWRGRNRAGVCCVCCVPSDNVVLLLRAGKKNCFRLQWKPLNRHLYPVVDARVEANLEKMEERRKKNTVLTFFRYIYVYLCIYIVIQTISTSETFDVH